MGSMSIVHWMVVVGVIVLLFGRGKISGLMGDVAQGIKSFQRGLADDKNTEPQVTPGSTLIATAQSRKAENG